MNLHIHKLKSVAGRATAFVTAVGFLGATVSMALPGLASADALNPLTERSLMLSSSSPGWAYTDGSGNTTYAPPGSGANGQKTGETFSFKVSTDSTSLPIEAFTLQYCTGAAGICTAPGDNSGSATTADRGSDTASTSDLNVNYSGAVQNTDFEIWVNGVKHVPSGADEWTMTVSNEETNPSLQTGKNNFVTLTNVNSTITPASGQEIRIIFKASATDYITNPGSGAFFVRLNTYSDGSAGAQLPDTDANIIDGGVTVANVMNKSIWITTKVLETMAFSVGTLNPDTSSSYAPHGTCDMIPLNERIQLGDSGAEYSLKFDEAYDANSYWRLATNSSSGATVYYSGTTLNNTVGDNIDAIGTTAAKSHPGTEQFGIAFDDPDTVLDTGAPSQLMELNKEAAYDTGTGGTINAVDFNDNASFAFDSASNTIPRAIASNTADVVTCTTAKMRYVANIAPSTPAGVYTTKINYIAAPQY